MNAVHGPDPLGQRADDTDGAATLERLPGRVDFFTKNLTR